MKVLIVYPRPNIHKSARFGYSISARYISESLSNSNIENIVCDYSVDSYSDETIVELLRSATHLVIEIDSFPLKRSENTNHALRIIDLSYKKFPHIIIIAYGKYCTLSQQPVPQADLTIFGEGELSIHEFVKASKKLLPKQFHCGLIRDLDTLPTIVNFDQSGKIPPSTESGVSRRFARSILLETSRGCPGSCSFCQRHGWIDGYRQFSTRRVLDDFTVITELGYQNVWVVDENFSASLSRAKDLLDQLASINSKKIKIALSSWVEIDEEFLELAKRAGVSIISFGIESANSHIQEFYNKTIDLQRTADLISYADRIGLYTVGNFIIGAPMESKETIEETLNYAINAAFDECNFKILDYMLGSDLFRALPNQMQSRQTHYFACKENDLGRFLLQELIDIAQMCLRSFNESRMSRLQRKIQKHGTPYYFK